MTTKDDAIQDVHRDVMSGAYNAVLKRCSDDEDLYAIVGRTLVALERGENDTASRGAEAALVLAQSVTMPTSLRGWALWLAGTVEGTIGGPDAAVLCMQRAAQLFQQAERGDMSQRSRGFAARMVSQMGDTAQAIQLYEALVGTHEASGELGGEHPLFLARLHALKGNDEAASTGLEEAHLTFTQNGPPILAAEALFDLACIAARRGRFTAAQQMFAAVMETFRGLGAHRRYCLAVCEDAQVRQWIAPDGSGASVTNVCAAQQCVEMGIAVPLTLRFWQIRQNNTSASRRLTDLEALLKEANNGLNKQAAILCHLGFVESSPSHDVAAMDFHLGRVHALLVQCTQPDRNVAVVAEQVAKRLLHDGIEAHRWRACRLLETAYTQWKRLHDEVGLERMERYLSQWRTLESGVCLGDYDLIARLGSGPFGESWRGRVSRTGLPVILRVMNARALPRRGTQRTLKDTITRLSRIHHSSLASTLGVEEATAFTEWVTQRSIRQGTLILVSVARPDFTDHTPSLGPELFETVCTVLQGLSVLHRHGFLHLSLTPDSIWHQPNGDDHKACIADYVLPNLLRTAMGARLDAAAFPFLAPEQRQGEGAALGAWSDLYSFGMVIYWWLFGELYDPGQSDIRVVDRLEPEGMGRWLSLLLEQRPTHRFQTATEALAAWWGLFGQEGSIVDVSTAVESMESDTTREIVVTGQLGEDDTPTVVVSRVAPPDSGTIGEEVTMQVPGSVEDNTKTLAGWPRKVAAYQWGPTPHPPKRWHRVFPEVPAIEDPEQALHAFQQVLVPMFGRHKHRDVLWTALRETALNPRIQICTIEGAAGVGKTRLTQWFEEAIRRWGGADVLRCTARTSQALSESLSRRLLMVLGCYGLRTPQILSAVQRAFPKQSEMFQQTLSRILATQVGMTLDEETGHPQALACLVNALCLLSEHRLIVLCLDDYHSACGFSQVLARLGALQRRILILVVAEQVVFQNAIVPDSRCVLHPFQPAETKQFIRGIVPIHLELADRLAALSAGVPAYVVQWLEECIRSDAVRVQQGQFRLREGIRLDDPESLTDSWRRRLARIFQDFSIQATMGVLLGAIWGRSVPKDIWLEVCEAELIFDPNDIVAQLQLSGLVWVDDDAWGFSDARFHQACISRARELGEYPRLNRMYLDCLDQSNRRGSRKYASLCVEGGTYARAVPLLIEFAERELLRERISEAVHTIEQLRRCIAALALTPGDATVGHLELLSLDLSKRHDATFDLMSALNVWFKAAEQHQWDGLWGKGHRMMGQARRWANQVSTANHSYGKALAWAEATENTIEVSLCCYGLGVNAQGSGDFDKARAFLQRVIDNEPNHPDLPLNAFAVSAMAACHLSESQWSYARASFEQAGGIAARLGYQDLVADALMGEGEVAKAQGDLNRARERYQKALDSLPLLAHPRRANLEMNVCTLLLSEGKLEQAGERLQPVLNTCRRLGLEQSALSIEVLLLPYWVGKQTELAWATHFASIQSRVDALELVTADLALAYESALLRVVAQGWSRVAMGPYQAACAQWSRLNQWSRLESLKVKFAFEIDSIEDS